MKCCSCRSSWHVRLSFQICPWKKHKDSKPTHKHTHWAWSHTHRNAHMCQCLRCSLYLLKIYTYIRTIRSNTHTEGQMIILAYQFLTFLWDSWNRYHRQPECVRLRCQSQSLSTVVLPKFFIHILYLPPHMLEGLLKACYITLLSITEYSSLVCTVFGLL